MNADEHERFALEVGTLQPRSWRVWDSAARSTRFPSVFIGLHRWPKPVFSAFVLALVLSFGPAVHARCGDRTVEPGETCDDGNVDGGDGCAANCTGETQRNFLIDPERSFAATQLAGRRFEFGLHGLLKITTGELREDGIIPFVIRRQDITLERVAVPGLVCSCVFSREEPSAGPGNIGAGLVLCTEEAARSGPYVPEFVKLSQDHYTNDSDPTCDDGTLESAADPHPGVCRGPINVFAEGRAGSGTAFLLTNLTLRLILDGGTCSTDPTNPAKGPDGVPCTADDPAGTPQDTAQVTDIAQVVAFSGTQEAEVLDVNNAPEVRIGKDAQCGEAPCEVEANGERFDCGAILADPGRNITSGAVSLSFPVLDGRPFGDAVVSVRLVPSARPRCAGDCSADATVTVDELVQAVNVALGSADIIRCPNIDLDGDGMASINELVAAVRSALEGCP